MATGRELGEMDDEQEVVDAVLKFVVLALAVGAVLGLVTFLVVKTLGVTGGDTSTAADPTATDTPSALPTVALTQPGSSRSAQPSGEPSQTPTTEDPVAGSLTLTAASAQVAPGQQINLSGAYPGQDGISLQVQRKDGGRWGPFADVTVPVRGGTFATYIITSRTGLQRFRVFDTTADKGSNPVRVTVG